jgi:hypothetical protein
LGSFDGSDGVIAGSLVYFSSAMCVLGTRELRSCMLVLHITDTHDSVYFEFVFVSVYVFRHSHSSSFTTFALI